MNLTKAGWAAAAAVLCATGAVHWSMRVAAALTETDENVWDIPEQSHATMPTSDGSGYSSSRPSEQASQSSLTTSASSNGLPDSSPVNGKHDHKSSDECLMPGYADGDET